MMRRVSVSDGDLVLAAAGCRSLAYRYREEAKHHTNPQLVEGALKRAEHAMHLAAQFDFESSYRLLPDPRDPRAAPADAPGVPLYPRCGRLRALPLVVGWAGVTVVIGLASPYSLRRCLLPEKRIVAPRRFALFLQYPCACG